MRDCMGCTVVTEDERCMGEERRENRIRAEIREANMLVVHRNDYFLLRRDSLVLLLEDCNHGRMMDDSRLIVHSLDCPRAVDDIHLEFESRIVIFDQDKTSFFAF